MKCKSWLNEFNNFVVRKVKSIKINGQQQVLSNTMPAMPKEKSTPVSLSESNFSELEKMKEQLMMTSSTQSNLPTSNSTNNGRYGGDHHNQHHLHHHHHQQQHHQQSHHRNSVCGCGAISAPIDTMSRIPNVLTAASTVTASNGSTSCSTALNTATTTCPRSKQHHHNNHHHHNHHNNHHQQQNGKTNLTTTTTDSNKLTSCSSSASSPIKTKTTSTSSSNSSTSPASSSTPPTTGTTPPKKSPNDFVFGKVIGEGSFSTVFLAMDVHTKREYAIKVCEKQHIIRERKQEYIRREREVMNIMTNVPGFVNLSCTFQDNRSLYFVMTIAKNGDLLPYINKVGSFDLDCTRHYAAELVLACENMHKRNIVHRDLKPENILLDENMHTLIADFGSAKILDNNELLSISSAGSQQTSISTPSSPASRSSSTSSSSTTTTKTTTATATTATMDSNQQHQFRRRKNSFVGTAQYVSPEVLQSQPIQRTADLWALGCIIYQMISGLPPFRGNNEFMIFKEILNCNLEFPEGFDKNAEDLVRKLLKLNPNERIGAHDKIGFYESIRSHPFFDGVNFDTIREQTPPTIYPYLPGVSKDEDFRSQYRVPDDLEPGLGDRQLTRLLGMELGTSMDGYEAIERKTVRKNIFDLSDAEKQKRLEQQKSDKWHPFAKGEVILKKGFVNKRKGLFARRRMLLLTTGPRLIYIDPVHMIEKGEIPWSSELRVEPKNFKIFFVHTPDRTYYLDDPEGYSLEWVNAIENVRNVTYNDQQDSNKKSSS